MRVYFLWHDKTGRNNFKVWKLYPTMNRYWAGQIWHFNLWKWTISFDFRKEGFLGHIKETIWKGRLKNRLN